MTKNQNESVQISCSSWCFGWVPWSGLYIGLCKLFELTWFISGHCLRLWSNSQAQWLWVNLPLSKFYVGGLRHWPFSESAQRLRDSKCLKILKEAAQSGAGWGAGCQVIWMLNVLRRIGSELTCLKMLHSDWLRPDRLKNLLSNESLGSQWEFLTSLLLVVGSNHLDLPTQYKGGCLQ